MVRLGVGDVVRKMTNRGEEKKIGRGKRVPSNPSEEHARLS